ncbi:MAG: NAD(P)/FAD-dependent oxidoreductase, partial [Caldilineaceae bacterium]|nr:NAD(P)/FAD-dependent oxidoreductase [Caldilineaceae bacterium]
GYFLSKQGMAVEIYEASSVLGGLAGPLLLNDGAAIDRFYHAILSSDSQLRDLCDELGIADQLRFRTTKMGFYTDGMIHPMNGIGDFLRFPPLGWTDRMRLGLTVLAAQSVRDWQTLEGISIEEWLTRWGGRNAYEHLWRPMLRAKFDGGADGNFAHVPATWIWSRLVRMKSTRSGTRQKEEAGHLIGGYATLMAAMAEKIRTAGGEIHLNTPVQEVLTAGSRLRGVRIDGQAIRHEMVVCTMQAPLFSRLIPAVTESYRRTLAEQPYLGIVCPLLVLDRPLTDYWTINITDETVPFTGIIETTNYIDPGYVGGNHLVYLPKYTAPDSCWLHKPNGEIEETWLHHLQRMFPHFDPSAIREFRIHRERFVEPLHGLNEYHKIPQMATPVGGLYLVTTAQIYPALTNGESVSRHAQWAANQLCKAAVPAESAAGSRSHTPAGEPAIASM